MNPAKIVIEGEVSPEFLAGVQALQQRLAGVREEAEKVGNVAPPAGLERLREGLRSAGDTARNINELREAVTGLAGTVAAAAAGFAQSAAAGDLNARAVRGLGGGYSELATATNGTVTALAAYRAQQALVNSGLRVSSSELATIARHAREHRDVTKSSEEAVQELTEALRNGEAEGLRKYGIAVEQGATRAQTFERALRQMRTEAAQTTPATRTLAESLTVLESGTTEAASGLALLISRGLGLDDVVNNLASDIRTLGSDLTDLNERAARARGERVSAERRASLQSDSIRAMRELGTAADQLGVPRSALPANINRLTTDQLEEVTGQMMALAARQRSVNRASVGDLIEASRGGAMEARAPDVISFEEARDRLRRGGPTAGQVRQELSDGLRNINRLVAGNLRANARAQRPPPRDRVPGGAGDNGPVALSDEAQASLAPFALGTALREAVRQQAEPFWGNVEALQRAIAGESGLSRAAVENDNAIGSSRSRAGAAIDAERDRQQREKDQARVATEEARRDEFNTRENQTRLERERAYLDERARLQESFTERFEQLHRRQTDATDAAVATAETAWQSAGKALGQHVLAVVRGQETVGEAAIGAVTDVVTALGQESIVKAAMETAEGVAMLAGVYTAPLAPGHFAAAAAYAAVGAAALGAGAILGAATGGGASAPAAPAGPALPPPTQADAAAAGSMQLTIVYGSGILGTPHDLARNIRDTLIEGESRGIRLPSRTVDQRAA